MSLSNRGQLGQALRQLQRRAAGQAQQAVAPRTITADRVVLSVSQTDPGRQEAMGQYVDITEAGIAPASREGLLHLFPEPRT